MPIRHSIATSLLAIAVMSANACGWFKGPAEEPGRDAKGAVQPFNGKDLTGWKTREGKGTNLWAAGVASVSKTDPKRLELQTGQGELVNLAVEHGDSLDLHSTTRFGDAHIELDVMVPKDSNSGIYVMGEYEIQVLDSWGVTELKLSDMGAVYGVAPPRVNATRPPGEWQHYVIDFRAPRFDKDGKKTANARLQRVELNGKVIQEDAELKSVTPGGLTGQESPLGPLMFQGNHGPVAYRNIHVTPVGDAGDR